MGRDEKEFALKTVTYTWVRRIYNSKIFLWIQVFSRNSESFFNDYRILVWISKIDYIFRDPLINLCERSIFDKNKIWREGRLNIMQAKRKVWVMEFLLSLHRMKVRRFVFEVGDAAAYPGLQIPLPFSVSFASHPFCTRFPLPLPSLPPSWSLFHEIGRHSRIPNITPILRIAIPQFGPARAYYPSSRAYTVLAYFVLLLEYILLQLNGDGPSKNLANKRKNACYKHSAKMNYALKLNEETVISQKRLTTFWPMKTRQFFWKFIRKCCDHV